MGALDVVAAMDGRCASSATLPTQALSVTVSIQAGELVRLAGAATSSAYEHRRHMGGEQFEVCNEVSR